MKRSTAYCDRCESTVYSDDVHSCFPAAEVRAQQEEERALNATERAEFAQMRQTIMDQGAEIAALRPVAEAAAAWYEDRTSERELAVLAAVRAWREGRGCH